MKWAIIGVVGAFLGYEILKTVRSVNNNAIVPPAPVYNPPVYGNGLPPNNGGSNAYDLGIAVLQQGGQVFDQIWESNSRQSESSDYNNPAVDFGDTEDNGGYDNFEFTWT